MNVTVATAPVNWNNEDVPDFRPWTAYEQMLDEMVQAGYDATEFSSHFPADPAQAKQDLAARGLRPASTFVSLNLRDAGTLQSEIERAERRAHYVVALGGDVLIVADSGNERRRAQAGHAGPDDSLDDATWQRLIAGLAEVASRCKRLGVSIVFHNHVGTFVETEPELSRLLDMTDPADIGLCLDVGHALFGGGDVMHIMQRYGGRVQYVHLKDVDMQVLEQCRRDRRSLQDALHLGIFTEFGTGGVDFHTFFDALNDRNYSGWIVVEQDTSRKTPLESARLNREYLRSTFGL